MTTPTTPLACPPWCEQPAGHSFTSTDPASGTLVRDHVREFGPYIALTCAEHAVTHDGPGWGSTAPRLRVSEDVAEIELDVEQASTFAADFAAAVAALREATG